MPKNKSYVLTKTAENDFRQAKKWSTSRWGKEQTKNYFADLHQSAEYIAQNQAAVAEKDDLTAGTVLSVYPVREHYIVYLSIDGYPIIIVALIRQVRDVPEIIKSNHYRIRREIKKTQTSLLKKGS